MIKITNSPAVESACARIRDLLNKGDWLPGRVFLSVSKLAALLDISRVSVIRAVAQLKSEGLLHATERSRIRVGRSSGIPSSITVDEESWRLKRSALESDILSGRYSNLRALPSLKILQERYGCCFRTMKKVVRALANDGVVSLRKKRYELILAKASGSSRRAVYIVNRSALKASSALNQGQYRVLELFEQECARRGLALDIMEMDFYNPAEVRAVMHGPAPAKPAEGFVIDLWWYESEEFLESYLEILTRLSALKKPVTILDELGEARLPQSFIRNPFFQLFCIEGKRAGGAIARMLLSQGHKSVAFISAFHNQPYSQQRLQGIIEQYDRTGKASNVIPVVTDKIEQPFGYVLALSGLRDSALRKVIAVGRTESQADDMYHIYQRYKKRLTTFPLGPKERMAVKNNLAPLERLAHQHLDPGYFERASVALLDEAENHLTGAMIKSLFEQALAQSEVTAWVCVTDFVAKAAIKYLREKGMDVPGKISVTGFDNSPVLAFESHLTSYDFNAHGFVHVMLNFIARPPRPRGDYTHKAIEVPGTIIQRATVAAR